MYRKLTFKIRFLIPCILFFNIIVTLSVGIAFININQVALGFFIFFGGPFLSFLLFLLFHNLLDIIDMLFCIIRKTYSKADIKEISDKKFCSHCGRKLSYEELKEISIFPD